MKDHYGALGVLPTASLEQIKSAYRKLAHQFHPDKNPDPVLQNRFKEISEAYAVLSNSDSRTKYDRIRARRANASSQQKTTSKSGGAERNAPKEPSAKKNTNSKNDGPKLGEIFGEIWDQVFEKTGIKKGRDLKYHIKISLECAANGAEKEIQYIRSYNGATQERKLIVTIPKGVEAGQRLRIANEGEIAHGDSKPGDLMVVVEIEPHPYFRKTGQDIHLDLYCKLNELVAGAQVRVPTLSGFKYLTLPAGSQSGDTLRLKSEGFPDLRTQKCGHLFVHLVFRPPRIMDEKVSEVLRQVDSSMLKYEEREKFEHWFSNRNKN